MKDILKPIIEVQELDMKMIRLMRIKRERQKELKQIEELRGDLHAQVKEKKVEIQEVDKKIRSHEAHVEDIQIKLKSLETRQSQIKKIEEFNVIKWERTKWKAKIKGEEETKGRENEKGKGQKNATKERSQAQSESKSKIAKKGNAFSFPPCTSETEITAFKSISLPFC